MADEIKSEESEGPSRSLWLAALLVGAIVIAGVVLSVRGVLRDDPESTATPTTSTSSPASPAEGEDASVCGLKGHERSGSSPMHPGLDGSWWGRSHPLAWRTQGRASWTTRRASATATRGPGRALSWQR